MDQSDIDARKSRSTVQHFLEAVSRVQRGYDDDALDDALGKKNMHSPGEQKKQQDRRHSNLRYTKDNHLRKILIHLAFKCRTVVQYCIPFSILNDSFPEGVYSKTLESYHDVYGAKLKKELNVV